VQGGANPSVSFRSSSRYTRVGYLDCSLTSLTCTVSPEISSRDGGWRLNACCLSETGAALTRV